MHPSGSLPVHFTCYMYIVVLDFPSGTGHKVEEWGGVDQDQKKLILLMAQNAQRSSRI